MRDDFDSVVADRFKVLDEVPVPDTWSRVRTTEELLTVLDLETTVPTEPAPEAADAGRGRRHLWRRPPPWSRSLWW